MRTLLATILLVPALALSQAETPLEPPTAGGRPTAPFTRSSDAARDRVRAPRAVRSGPAPAGEAAPDAAQRLPRPTAPAAPPPGAPPPPPPAPP
ncbi:MAG TPA: hypothetical protein VFG59_10445, partial [Anaeromyxobacter sp.]|nr:hypothetical protein [Anaeromyxobacter sp.]